MMNAYTFMKKGNLFDLEDVIFDITITNKNNKQEKNNKKPSNKAPKSIKGDYDLSIHGNKIVLVDNVDGTTVESKCHPDDNFDIGAGIQEAFKKLNVERQKNRKEAEEKKPIKHKDKVVVTNSLLAYPTYKDWCYKYLPFNLVRKFNYGQVPYSGLVGQVVAIAPHLSYENGTLVAIEDKNKNIYVIDVRGIKKVVD